jgi:type IV secretion system protein VirB10
MNRISALFPKRSVKADPPGEDASPEASEPASVPGERGIASVNQHRSLQSRISNLMAMGLMGAMGLGLLGWYYSQTYAHQREAKDQAQSATRTKAQGDLPLPSIGRVDPPGFVRTGSGTADAGGAFGGPPPMPPEARARPAVYGTSEPAALASGGYVPAAPTVDRRLDGPVFSAPGDAERRLVAALPAAGAGDGEGMANGPPEAGMAPGAPPGSVAALLRPTVTPAVRARVLPTQQMLLPKGAFIDCTLETAIDSSLPGLTTCVTATDTFGADGKVVLLERGTKLVGETRGEVRQGTARVFVLWTEARTPTGVVVPLASPGTDELGRSGLPGVVDRHFLDRFGAAILISMIDGTIQAAAQSRGGSGTVIYNPSNASDVVTEVLKSTVNIPPTVRKQNGDRIQILVARDLDFRSVYELRSTANAR